MQNKTVTTFTPLDPKLGNDLEKLSRRIAATFQIEGDWPWTYVMGEIKEWLGHPDIVSLAQERDELEKQLAAADAVIAHHWYGHKEDWKIEDQAQPVKDALQRHSERQEQWHDQA